MSRGRSCTQFLPTEKQHVTKGTQLAGYFRDGHVGSYGSAAPAASEENQGSTALQGGGRYTEYRFNLHLFLGLRV